MLPPILRYWGSLFVPDKVEGALAGGRSALLPSQPHLTSTPKAPIYLSNTTMPHPEMHASSSIQSFFTSSPTKNNDGFTADEVQSVLQPAGPSVLTAWTVCINISLSTYLN